MIKELQSCFFVMFILSVPTLLKAQTDRTKLSSINAAVEATENSSVPVKSTSKEKQEISNTNPEYRKSIMQYKSQDPVIQKQSLQKDNDIPSLSKANASVSDNVTYNKEELPENKSTISSEKNPVKIVPSENFKLKTVKADIHPVVDYSSAGIADDKRIYLQQEADALQQEINLNATNADYDLAKKQKHLEDIRKMLQK